MRTSEEISELLKALNAVQKEMKPAVKTSNNPHFKQKYADYESVLKAASDALCKNGLVWTHAMLFSGDQFITRTRLFHVSGQWIESDVPVVDQKGNMQGIGSAFTYGKRYGLKGLLGLPDDDDDGEGSLNRSLSSNAPTKPYTVTTNQLKRLMAIAGKLKVSNEQVKSLLKSKYNLDSAKELNSVQYNELVEHIEKTYEAKG